RAPREEPGEEVDGVRRRARVEDRDALAADDPQSVEQGPRHPRDLGIRDQEPLVDRLAELRELAAGAPRRGFPLVGLAGVARRGARARRRRRAVSALRLRAEQSLESALEALELEGP